MMGNLSALLMVFVSFLAPLLSPRIRTDRTLLVTCWVTLSFRHALALFNAFVTPISNTWEDMYAFHNVGAGNMAAFNFYGSLLFVLYKIFGVSFWLGETFSVLIYAFSLVLFVEIGQLVGAGDKLNGCVLVFGLMPSPAIHCSVPLRESYQVLGFLGVAYAMLSIRIKPTRLSWALLFFSLFLLVLMHQSLGVFVLGVFALGLPWAMQGWGQAGSLLAFLFLSLTPMIVPLAMDSMQEDSPTVKAIAEGRLLNYAADYRNWVEKARSDYGLKIDSTDVLTFSTTATGVVAMYFVAPLPWQVSSTIDYYAFFEVVVRLLLLYGCLARIQASKGEARQRLLFLFCMAMGLEFLWALGTTNWGTSLRHHTVAFGALVLLGFPHFSSFTVEPELAKLLSRRQRRKEKMEAG